MTQSENHAQTFRFRLVGGYTLDVPVNAADLATAKEKLRREEVDDGVVTPQEMGRRLFVQQEGWLPQSVDDYMSALTDVGLDSPIFDSDYGCALIVRELPYAEGPEQSYRFTLSIADDAPWVTQVTAPSLYAAIDQILDGNAALTSDDADALEIYDETLALFAMLTAEQRRYEDGLEAVSWELVPTA